MMRACVVFASRYGSTERIEAGFQRAGLQTLCVNANEIDLASLMECDLICIGGWMTTVKRAMGRH